MQSIGYETGYAYDDLVISDNAVFILQFGNVKVSDLSLFINRDCWSSEAKRIAEGLIEHAEAQGLSVSNEGTFTLSQQEGTEKIELVFIKSQ
ncbi:MAG: hypothetical protein HC896_18520 [Bacteroidales bacterium]|nr:hypothetical protein [Bacteroidales bacterium]